MQIVIPMSGLGERFRDAGFDRPKPLVEVSGAPMIAHIINLFPNATSYLFICNQEHLDQADYLMANTIKTFCREAKVVGIAPHKLGPVHAILEAQEYIKKDEPVLVSYCDYGARWDFQAFKAFVESNNCDGAVIGYTDFHPHMLRNHAYGYARTEAGEVIEIREKQSFTPRPMEEIALAGAYYFKDPTLMLEAFHELVKEDALSIAGEHYVSLAFPLLMKKGLVIRPFLLERFLQWGTPEDLADYVYWEKLFELRRKKFIPAKHKGCVLVPMAGEGRRFKEEDYDKPKPLIEIEGKPMAVRALGNLPLSDQTRAVLRRDMPNASSIEQTMRDEIPTLEVLFIDSLSEGQAMTALAGLSGLPDDMPVTIGACDNGMIYDGAAFNALFADERTDVILWGCTDYPAAQRNASAYGWIGADEAGLVKEVSVKKPLLDPKRDPFVVGTFTFRRAGDFRRCVERMQQRDARINGEFYIDTAMNDAIQLGLSTRLFLIQRYIGWGTPNELRTYLYWSSFFDQETLF